MNNSTTYKVLGVMSGTSLDGIDLANCEFVFQDSQWAFNINETITIPYSKEWVDELTKAFEFDTHTLDQLSIKYAQHISKVIERETSTWDYDYIASHGHTILHQPENGFTIQIGDGQIMANILNKKIIYDFRTQDVKLGGQGAPLVPIGDRLLFNQFDYRINLGGFANISYENNDTTLAYDICPINFVCNALALTLGKPYDENGDFAREGIVIPSLLEELNYITFYNLPHPKSMGREWVEIEIDPIISKYNNTHNILRTFVEHSAIQISKNLSSDTKTALFTGGGVYNSFLMERISHYSPTITISHVDKEIIEFKEALIFAFLGVLKLRNENNTLASVTGASHDHSAGKISIPKNV